MNPIDKNKIIDALKNSYNLNVTNLEELSLGADLKVSIYRAKSAEGAAYFIKLRSDFSEDLSLKILSFLKKEKIGNLILPLEKNRQAEAEQKFRLSVYPYIEGKNAFEKPLTEKQWTNLGKTLKKIHRLEIPKSLKKEIRREDFSSETREKVKLLLSQISQLKPQSQAGKNLIHLFLQQRDSLGKIVEFTSHLEKKVKEKNHKFVLCHGDLHAGNILLSQDDKLYIVDWDNPVIAPIERDLMFIGAGIGNVWNKSEEEEIFYQNYKANPLDQELLAYYRLQRILEDVVAYSDELIYKTSPSAESETLYQEMADQFNKNGVIEIAFTSYQKIS